MKVFALLFTAALGAVALGDVTLPDKEVVSAMGSERLTLYHVASEPESTVASGRSRTTVGYEFHSLIWCSRSQSGWVTRAQISQDDFQRGTDHRRWIADIHSVDASTGSAIVKVAEGDAPMTAGRVQYVRTWREWDLRRNRELRTIRICKEPNEPY